MSSIEDLMNEKKTLLSNISSITTAMASLPDGLPIKAEMKSALDKYSMDLQALTELVDNIKNNTVYDLKARVKDINKCLDDLGINLANKRNEMDEIQSFIDVKRSERKCIEDDILRIENAGEIKNSPVVESVMIESDIKKKYTAGYFAAILAANNVKVSHTSQSWIEVIANNEKTIIAVARSYRDVFKIQMLSNVKFVALNFNSTSPDKIGSYLVFYTDVLRSAISNGILMIPYADLQKYKSFTGVGFLQNLLRN
jgi:hypothetical protein